MQTAKAMKRSCNNTTVLFRDEWTAVARSSVSGHGLFSMARLPARFVLYAYTGTIRTAEEASRRPNAFMFHLHDGSVCDAGPFDTSSPARWVNTQPFDKLSCCNCEYQEYEGKVYLITLRAIPPMQELFASYGEGKTPFADWPQGFLGDGHEQVSEYRNYLSNIPESATSSQKRHARKLMVYLKEDLKSDQFDIK